MIDGDATNKVYTAEEAQTKWEGEAEDAKSPFYFYSCGEGANTVYGDGQCSSTTVNTIRVCKSFAEDLWGDDGSDLDNCGMSIWTGAEATWDNPNGITAWGDVDGTTGDDPILPSKQWTGYHTFFRDTRPPLLDQFFVRVVPDKEGHCFDGAAGVLSAPVAFITFFTTMALLAAHLL